MKKGTPIVIAICLIAVVVVAIGAFSAIYREEGSADTKQDKDDAIVESNTASEKNSTDAKGDENKVNGDNTKPVSTDTVELYIDPDIDPSYFRVINRSYPIDPGYIAGSGELKSIEGKQMEKNAADALAKMVAALRNEGMDIIIQSGYRTDEDQEYLYNRQINRQNGNKEKAATISAVPLTSEHQAGLAVDLSTDGTLLETFADTKQGQWLKKHCAEYGFILRYLPEKTLITGIINEPWHFRYVGSAAQAEAITESGLCMEEYFNKYLTDEDLDPYLPYLQ